MTRIARPHKRAHLDATPFKSRSLKATGYSSNAGETRRQNQRQPSVCFCCGSAEHSLQQCEKYRKGRKKDPLPFAHCFVCNQQGHLAASCDKNERGIYPRGGGCRVCSSVRHLARDCPEALSSARKQRNPEQRERDADGEYEDAAEKGVRLGLMDLKQSADDDDVFLQMYRSRPQAQAQQQRPAKTAQNKKKIVVF